MALVLGGIVWVGGGSASAGGCDVTTGNDEVNGGVTIHGADCGDVPSVITDVGSQNEIRDSDLDAICVNAAMTMGLDPFRFCDEPSDGGNVEITPGFVAHALRFVPLPPALLLVQPSNGRTLVNFDTNFFAEIQPFDTTIPLLGQQVDLHAVPSKFNWQFGDGESLATAEPGAPYPDLDVTHRYLKKGMVAPSVDTTYTAEFRVNGGAWEDVPGSVTIAGTPVELEVLTATPTLVGYDRG